MNQKNFCVWTNNIALEAWDEFIAEHAPHASTVERINIVCSENLKYLEDERQRLQGIETDDEIVVLYDKEDRFGHIHGYRMLGSKKIADCLYPMDDGAVFYDFKVENGELKSSCSQKYGITNFTFRKVKRTLTDQQRAFLLGRAMAYKVVMDNTEPIGDMLIPEYAERRAS